MKNKNQNNIDSIIMQKKNCFLFGTIFKLHGFKGEVNIYNDDNLPFDFSTLKYFLIELNNQLIPYFINKARPTKQNIVLVKFEDVNSEEEAKKIHKRKVYVPKHWLQKREKNEIREKQLIGYTVNDLKLGNIGKIIYTNSQTKQQLIYVNKDGKEFCFPMHEQFVKEIDATERIMKVNIPEELLNLN